MDLGLISYMKYSASVWHVRLVGVVRKALNGESLRWLMYRSKLGLDRPDRIWGITFSGIRVKLRS